MLPFATERRRHKVARGGRGGAKSHSIAKLLLAKGMQSRQRWLCAREVQKSIRDSVHKLLADQIELLGIGDFYDVQRDVIKGANGSEFLFAGLRDHTVDSIKSYEGCDGCWIEEAHSVTERSATVLIPTIRKPGSELWWSYNPDQEDDFVHQLANSGRDDVLVVDIGWRDNPWFPAELEGERKKLQAINDDLYQHVWEGKCRSVAGLLFKRPWFRRYDRLPERLNLYIASDYAVSEDEGDWTEHGVWGLDEHGDLYAVDWWSGQTAPDTWIKAWLALVKRHKPLMAFEEKGVILRSVDGAINKAMREAQTFVHREGLASAGNKASRALGFAARASAGTVWLPKTDWGDRLLNQLCAFNGEDGRVDDMVDVCSLIGRGLDEMADASPKPKPKKKPEPKPFTEAWMDRAEQRDQAERDQRERYYL
jgi:predicted phage terminase large subunit-like protein